MKFLEVLLFYTFVPQMAIMMYGSWYIKRDRQNFLSFWAIFCPLPHLQCRKSKFWKNEKAPRDIIILVYHKWQWYDIWLLRYQLQHTDFFFLISGHFLSFYPLTAPKMKISKKWKRNTWRNHHFTEVYQKSWLYPIMFPRSCMMPWRMTDVIIIFPFGLFFALLPPLTAGKMRYHHFTLVYQKSYLYPILFLRYGTWWM